ncbi:glycosyltransferase [Aurantiacibacter sediminis]|uniref:Glycosyltransferase n=1 Tax=Aurantiacibacter sediminis TaxID=2793064 RepID=A0ABS0N5G2_9SPHN|nr:glycosyltransferase [Aurantiacibacter sediminis]MBH5323027.1 glycosyltransferase [Aurantiacibacter sediminis]
MLTSTLPRFLGDAQANFVGEQAAAWSDARPEDAITILAPHDKGAAHKEHAGRVAIERFRYFAPESWQKLAYPAILPNIRRNPFLLTQIAPFMAAGYRAASRIVRERNIDFIYAHWVMPQGLIAHRLHRKFDIPYVLQNHSSDLAVFDKLGGAGRRMARAIIREAVHFFCVNSDQREAALAMVMPEEREAIARKITVLPMGVQLPQLEAKEGQTYHVGSIGRLSKKKGLDRLIDAAELLADRGITPRIGIAGDGEESAALQRRPEQADVNFPGFVAGPAKDQFMASCERFAFPAKASQGDVEGLPVALLEALCTGRRVLASTDTNIRLLTEWEELREHVEFIADPDDIAALADALQRLLERPSTPNPAQEEIVARYRWDRLIEEYLRPIEAVMQGR